MRVRSVGHACLEIEAAGLRVVTDPWWAGPAFAGQWEPWPAPRPAGLESRPIDYLYLSHAHEDHFHPETLRTLRPGATALVPELLFGNLARRLRKELGFCEVIELVHGRTVTLRRGLKVTCYVNLADSILVLEDGDRVLVDVNDALHTAPRATIDHFCSLLRRNHPSIDTLFSGYAGGSWFPNCVRVRGKDDRAVARGRAELYADNFLHIVDRLHPRVACAFTPGFLLTEQHNHWINQLRIDAPTPDQLFRLRRQKNATRCHLLLPDDVVDGIDITSGGCPRPSRETMEEALATRLAPSRERLGHLRPLPPDALRGLVQRLSRRVAASRSRLGSCEPFAAELRLRDNPSISLRVEVDRRGARASLGPPREAAFSLELRADILEAMLAGPAGLDAILLGHGATVHLPELERLERVDALFTLLSGRRRAWDGVMAGLRHRPLSTLSRAWRQRWPIALELGARMGLLSGPHNVPCLDEAPKVAGERVAA